MATSEEIRTLRDALRTLSGGKAARYLGDAGVEELAGLLRGALNEYLPLTGGEVTGDLKVEKTLTAETIINSQEIDINSEIGRFNNMGETRLTLTENADAPNVVVADGEGKLYSAPASGFSGGGMAAPGVYAAYVDNESLVNGICAPSEWDGGYRTFCGGLIVGAGWNILVAPDWSTTRALTSGYSNDSRQYVTVGEAYAAADFDGRGNTTAEMDAGTGSSSSCGIYYADTYSCGGVGPGKWWVPSAGELMEVMRNWDALQELFAVVYPSRMTTVFTRLWSSTGYSYNSAWTVGTDGSLGWENKYGNGDYVYPVLPVSSFRW